MKIPMIAELEASTGEEAQRILDAFREAVQPNNYGISLYRNSDVENVLREFVNDIDRGFGGVTVTEDGFIAPACDEEATDLGDTYMKARKALGMEPVNMMLYCPSCDDQHIDAPQPDKGWTNPPHRTHQCQFCGHEWRPSETATNGVEAI